MAPPVRPKSNLLLLVTCTILLDVPAALSAGASSPTIARARCGASLPLSFPLSASIISSPHRRQNKRHAAATIAFQHCLSSSLFVKQPLRSKQQQIVHGNTALFNGVNNEDTSSFLSTSKSSVSFKNKNNNNNSNSPSNLSPIDQLLLTLTSDRTSLLLGSIGILLLLLNRFISFPEDPMYEASRSRIDLLGVFAAGSVLLNGITKLDVESAQAERVVLEGTYEEDTVTWIASSENQMGKKDDNFQSTVEWALSSFLKCSPARTAVLLTASPNSNKPWTPLATAGILPSNPQLRSSIPADRTTPILDRMLREDGSIKGGTVGGTSAGATNRKGPKESYLPTLQALPGKVEFTYLPGNAQEVLLLPVVRPEGRDGDGDTAKSFAPRDIAWCKEIAGWIGDLV